MLKRAVAVVVVGGLLLGLLVFSQRGGEPLRVSGFVEADEIRLGSRVGGRVKAVHVEEGDAVAAGQVLVELEEFDLPARKAEAEANLAAKRAALEQLERGYRPEEIGQAKARVERLEAVLERLRNGPRAEEINAARAWLRQAEAQVERARRTYERSMQLWTDEASAISREQLDRAAEQLKVAEATRDARRQELQLLENGTRPEDLLAAEKELEEARQAWLLMSRGYRREEIEQARAAVRAAQAAVDMVQAQLAELQIRAPTAGVVEALELQPGDLVAAGAPVLSLMDLSRLWIRTYVPEDELDVPRDAPLRITVDAFPGETFHGVITFVSRQAEFTPNNVQTPEDRAEQVFRVNVTLQDGLDRLRPGMMADVWLEP